MWGPFVFQGGKGFGLFSGKVIGLNSVVGFFRVLKLQLGQFPEPVGFFGHAVVELTEQIRFVGEHGGPG